MWTTSNTLSGHSTVDALRILHTELLDQIHRYEVSQRHRSMRHVLQKFFLHQSVISTAMDWCSVTVTAISILLLILSFFTQTVRDSGVMIAAVVLSAVLVINLVLLFIDDRLRKKEPIKKAHRVLQQLQDCMKEGLWHSSDYQDLNSPLSQCVTLQWTVRDSHIHNLPCGLLVEGDIILVRPGQTIPVKCRSLRIGDEEFDSVSSGLDEYCAGDLYNPAILLPEPPFCLQAEQRQPLKPQPYLVLETPIVRDFRLYLKESLNRPIGGLDMERHNIYNVWIERRVMLAIFLTMLLCNCLRFVLLKQHVGDWAELFLVLQIQALIPLMALIFPLAWRILDIYGISKVELACERFEVESKTRKRISSGDSFLSGMSDTAGDDAVTDDGHDLSLQRLYVKVKDILLGRATESLPRTASIVQAFGNMTSFCCVDKKGVLSWPNPTVEKVFILTSSSQGPTDQLQKQNADNHSSEKPSLVHQPSQYDKQQQQQQQNDNLPHSAPVRLVTDEQQQVQPAVKRLLQKQHSKELNSKTKKKKQVAESEDIEVIKSEQLYNSESQAFNHFESDTNLNDGLVPELDQKKPEHRHRMCSTGAGDGQYSQLRRDGVDNDDGFTEQIFPNSKNEYPVEAGFQVLNLTQDIKDQFGLHFDDPLWKHYISSLKPLGLNILLNTCNMSTADKYTEFADHVTCASLKRIEAVPVVNKRCFCELSRQIGFSDSATKPFQTEQVLGMYRHIPPDSAESDLLKSRKSFLKYQTPMPNMFSVVVRDTFTGSRQLFSQGMADMVLDACSDFWDGQSIRTLTEAERRKIADFYHRSSMSSYCTAFAYRPLTSELKQDICEFYLEVPDITVSGLSYIYSPFSKNSVWDSHRKRDGRGSRRKIMERDSVVFRHYHGSADSVICESLNDPELELSREWYDMGVSCGVERGRLSKVVSGGSDLAQKALEAQSEQIFVGMITMQYQAKQEVVHMIEALESSCIRFVHFSKENELRSRVFSEKMGLEAGWNCHISLRSDQQPGDQSKEDLLAENYNHDLEQDVEVEETGCLLRGNAGDRVFITTKQPVATFKREQQQQPLRVPQSLRPIPSTLSTLPTVRVTCSTSRRCRSYSSPTLLYVTSVSPPAGVKGGSLVPGSGVAMGAKYRLCKSESENDETVSHGRGAPPISHQRSSIEEGLPPSRRRHVSSQASVGTASSWRRSLSVGSTTVIGGESQPGGLLQRLHRKRSTNSVSRHSAERTAAAATAAVADGAFERAVEAGVELSMASSYSDILDEEGLGIANRAKLPKGVENIRYHIDNVDNVPLQVSLFTDCTPDATQEMLKILQEYGEVICCYGSAACISNGPLFLQADCSLSIEPLYPEICVRQSSSGDVDCSSSHRNVLSPMKLSALLYSLSCAFVLTPSSSCDTIIRLIAVARHHCKRVRSVASLYISCQLSVSLLQLFASVFQLPPILSVSSVLWLSLFLIPLISITLMGNPASLQVTKMALTKKSIQSTNQAYKEQILSYLTKHIPTLLICLFCHAFNLYTFCISSVKCAESAVNVSITITNTTPYSAGTCDNCHVLFGHVSLSDNATNVRDWNGWYTDYETGIILSQQLTLFLLVLSFVVHSLCSVHWFKYLWQRSPFANRLWCIVIPIVLVLQVLYFVIGLFWSGSDVMVSNVPIVTWVLLPLWPLLLIPLLELNKHRERRIWIRHQKRARLDFGTKLGMNSPF